MASAPFETASSNMRPIRLGLLGHAHLVGSSTAFRLEGPLDGRSAGEGDDLLHRGGVFLIVEAAKIARAKEHATVIAGDLHPLERRNDLAGHGIGHLLVEEHLYAVDDLGARRVGTIDQTLDARMVAFASTRMDQAAAEVLVAAGA